MVWIDEPMIQFEQLFPALPSRKFDLVFFTSPQTARAFYAAFPHNDLPAASLGAGTARQIPRHITQVFTGVDSAPEVINTFIEEFPAAKVLIPCGDRSFRRLQKALNPQQFEEVIVYHTRNRKVHIPTCAVYAFTSPSNVESFFSTHRVDHDAAYVAIGQSTAEALRKQEKNPRIAEDYGQKALARAIFSAIDS